MTKRIFRSILLVAFGVFFTAAALFLFALYDYFGETEARRLRSLTDLAARGVESGGIAYLEGLDTPDCRVTLISPDGTVLYDNRLPAAEMENHLGREEIAEALRDGEGESSRYSSTLTERYIYRAKRLSDGSVLRLSTSGGTVLSLFVGMLQPVAAILIVAAAVSLVLAVWLSKKITEPLKALDPDHPLSGEAYPELRPLLARLDGEQRELARQKEELAVRRGEFETVTRDMTEGIVLLNARGDILGLNRAARELFGVKTSPVGESFVFLSDRVEVAELSRAAREGEAAKRTVDLPGGKCELRLGPVLTDGARTGAVLLVEDVTERENAERIRREFTANVTHELKTPLHVIAGSAELLESGLVREEDKAEFYRRIGSEAGRTSRLVDDIIRLSRLDEGAAGFAAEDVDLYAAAGEVLEHLRGEAELSGVTLKLEGGSVTVRGARELVWSVIFNLCDNAVKYNRPGGSVTVTVERVITGNGAAGNGSVENGFAGNGAVEHGTAENALLKNGTVGNGSMESGLGKSALAESDTAESGSSKGVAAGNGLAGARLTVEDTGLGIPAEHRERVFERFYRVDKSRSRERGGTGLGLAIVKHAASVLGAEVSLASEENVGTTVTVTFPAKERP